MFENILSAFHGTYWAILPERLQEIEAFVYSRIEDGKMPNFEAAVGRGNSTDASYEKAGSVAIVPIHGTIYPRGGVNAMSGSTTAEAITKNLRAAVADKAVSSIVLDINSPGSSVLGTAEAAREIHKASMSKPVHAVANHVAASGAYWLGSQATSLSVAPNGQVGSIGVIRSHADYSAALEKRGVKITDITTAPHKAEGAPHSPLAIETAADWLGKCQEYHKQFVSAVAMGRNTTMERVEANFGQGRMVLPDQAKSVGMVDRIATVEDVVNSLQDRAAIKSRMYAASVREKIFA